MTRTLNGHLRTFMITARWTLRGMRKVSARSSVEDQNTFRAKYITSESRAIYEIITKNTARPDGISRRWNKVRRTNNKKKNARDLHAG